MLYSSVFEAGHSRSQNLLVFNYSIIKSKPCRLKPYNGRLYRKIYPGVRVKTVNVNSETKFHFLCVRK